MLSNRQIEQNYHQTLLLTDELFTNRLQIRGYQNNPESDALNEVRLSVAGCESVVELIMSTGWNREIYLPVIKKELEDLQKLLLPDIARRNVVSIDASFEWLSEIPVDALQQDHVKSQIEKNEILNSLSPVPGNYLKSVILPQFGLLAEQWLNRFTAKESEQDTLNDKLVLLQRFFPDGNFPLRRIADTDSITENQLKEAYLLELIGMKRLLPANLLDQNGEACSAILVRFLVSDILQTKPEHILQSDHSAFFSHYMLQNVYRYFNYSTNRVLANAYPELIPPWLGSKSATNYWEDSQNRIMAVQWLIEKRLKTSPEKIYRAKFSRTIFSENGLSYMFNRYYNSVAKALQEAYPNLRVWELGKVPSSYWTAGSAGEAVRWMINKCGWQVEALSAKVRSGEFNRKTFSQFGLATLFERYFSRSIFKALQLAYPGRFEIWEVGKVPRDYWRSRQNVYRAACWVAEKEGVNVYDIPSALKSGNLTVAMFHKYGIPAVLQKWSGGDLKAAFAPALDKAYLTYLKEQKLLRKIRDLKSAHMKYGVLYYLLYGFFLGDVQRTRRETARRFDRMVKRIERRMEMV